MRTQEFSGSTAHGQNMVETLPSQPSDGSKWTRSKVEKRLILSKPSAFLDVGNRSLAHIFFFIPERLQGGMTFQCQRRGPTTVMTSLDSWR
jgi:hypothetical protein